MSREWKPGDVALLMTEGGERVGFRCGAASNMGWCESGQSTWSADSSGYVEPIRQLVVLDPEDREQVERLAADFYAERCAVMGGDVGPTLALTGESYSSGFTDAMQAALRSLIAPPPVEVFEHYPHRKYSATASALCGKVWTPGGDVVVKGRCPECAALVDGTWVS